MPERFKSEAERAIDDVEAIANRIREKVLKDEAATAGFVRTPFVIAAFAIGALLGFIAGHISGHF